MILPGEITGLSDLLSQAGGKAYLVGGACIDMHRQAVPKDWDIEVHGLSMSVLDRVLTSYNPKPCGRAFGIFKLPPTSCGGYDVDISIPRLDNSIGVGHRDFEVSFDPLMSPEEASLRRDFTINAMFYNIATGEFVDPHGGRSDLEAGILRMTSSEKFSEDPVRCFRAMQLLSRKCKTVDPATMQTIRGMVDTYSSLASERVFEEFKKLLLLSDQPSIGLRFLVDSGWIKHFPALHDLVYWPGWALEENQEYYMGDTGCPHNPSHHPEGNVWEHTMFVVDNAAKIRSSLPEDDRLTFMLSALCHDLGKVGTTVLPNCSAHGHECESVSLAQAFLGQMTNEKKLIESVSSLVRYHMDPWQRKDAGEGSWRRLHRACGGRLALLGWLSRCDWAGRPSREPNPTTENGDPITHIPSGLCWKYASLLGKREIPRLVTGKILLSMGYTSGPEMGKTLARIYKIQLEHSEYDVQKLLSYL